MTIAKNLLLDRTCNNCVYLGKVHELCILRVWPKHMKHEIIENNNYISIELEKLPNEKTCENWELRKDES